MLLAIGLRNEEARLTLSSFYAFLFISKASTVPPNPYQGLENMLGTSDVPRSLSPPLHQIWPWSRLRDFIATKIGKVSLSLAFEFSLPRGLLLVWQPFPALTK